MTILTLALTAIALVGSENVKRSADRVDEVHRRFVLADESIREVASRLASREMHRVVCECMLTGGNAAAADIAKRKRGL